MMSLFKYSAFQPYMNVRILNVIIVDARNSSQTLKWNGAWGPRKKKKKKKKKSIFSTILYWTKFRYKIGCNLRLQFYSISLT